MPVFPRTPFSFPTTKAKAIVHQATARQHARRAALCGRSPDVDDIDFSPLSRRLRLSPCRPRRGCVESRPRPDRWGRRSRRCPCSQRGAKWAKAWRDRCSADTNSLHSALALFNCRPNNADPDWTKFASLEIAACRRERRGGRDTWGINVVDDAEVTFWTIYGRRKADRDGSEECQPITDCATRDHAQKIARILRERSGLSISTKLLIGNPAAPLTAR